MRFLAAAIMVMPALAFGAVAAAAQDGYLLPSCIASTLPGARAPQPTRFIPPEVKGEQAKRLRGVVQRGVMWNRGEVIKVCFHHGTQKAHDRVIKYAREWMQYANVVFDFEENGAPRKCTGSAQEDIKVSFMDGQGWWSVPGTISRRQNPSMNLQFWGTDTPTYVDRKPVPEAVMRTTILHEFGHALGLLHEHQSPTASCDAEIDWEAAYKIGAGIGWDKERVDRNFRQLVGSEEYNATAVDRRSIMHYSLPPQLFKRGKDSPCWVAENTELSQQDRTFIASLYPKDDKPVVVSTGPSPTATRGTAKQLSAGGDKQALVKQYEDILRQAGVAADKVRELVAEFRKTATAR